MVNQISQGPHHQCRDAVNRTLTWIRNWVRVAQTQDSFTLYHLWLTYSSNCTSHFICKPSIQTYHSPLRVPLSFLTYHLTTHPSHLPNNNRSPNTSLLAYLPTTICLSSINLSVCLTSQPATYLSSTHPSSPSVSPIFYFQLFSTALSLFPLPASLLLNCPRAFLSYCLT